MAGVGQKKKLLQVTCKSLSLVLEAGLDDGFQ